MTSAVYRGSRSATKPVVRKSNKANTTRIIRAASREKHVFGISDQVRHTPGCVATIDG